MLESQEQTKNNTSLKIQGLESNEPPSGSYVKIVGNIFWRHGQHSLALCQGNVKN